MKKQIDSVFLYIFAFLQKYKLEGKTLQVVLTMGWQEEAYLPQGSNLYSLEEFLTPIKATTNYLKLQYKPHMVIYITPSVTKKLDHSNESYLQNIQYIKNLHNLHLNKSNNQS